MAIKLAGPAPTNDSDISTKKYVDDKVATKLTYTGALTISSTVPSNSTGNDGDICLVYGS